MGFHINFSRALSNKEIEDYFLCTPTSSLSNAVIWTRNKWLQFGNVDLSEVDDVEFCKDSSITDTIAFPEAVTFDDALFLSNFVSCTLPPLDDTIDNFYDFAKTRLNTQV